jgi:hypothetical protein
MMPHRVVVLLALLGFLASPLAAGSPTTGTAADQSKPARAIDFNREIRPILSDRCFACHGPDAGKRKGVTRPLRLDTEEGMFADLGGYAAVVRGDPEESELVVRITSADALDVMPPSSSGKTLAPREVELLTEWVRQGAPYARHWSYVKPSRPPLPPVRQTSWPKNAVDRFILARIEQDGVKPAHEADRWTLIRRVSLDLTGLPPTPEEVDRFVADKSPAAYEALVARLLARPSYGEHWARPWLDLARYADSAGYADDPPRTIWAYRDYVIRALNANTPFDQFTLEQIAGDLLPHPTDEQLVATAFHRNTLTNNEGGTDDEEFRNVAVVDRVNTTMAVWMGTTMACAQCHDHKYDPLSQKEYFQLFAFFNNTEDADRRDESPLLPLADPKPGTTVPILRDLPKDKRRTTRLQHRGNFLDLGDEVTAGTPAVFPPLLEGTPRDRLALARWLVDEDNPLTARVLANRLWEGLFGAGLVPTSEDFGAQGDPPTHPELLDWLATELVRTRWDLKRFLALLVTSATYRQDARIAPESLQRDPDNHLLARGPRFRLSAETVRDQALFVAGLLRPTLYGPPVRPPQPPVGLSAAFGGGIDWTTSEGDDRYRRGLYTSWRRSNPYPSLATFDAPNREVCTLRRSRTNTPLQALVTLNDPVFVEAAQALARRIAAGGPTIEDRVRFGVRLCLARHPSDEELNRLVHLYEAARDSLAKDAGKARRLATEPLGPAPAGSDVVELAAWTVVGNVLLNLDEMLMKR